MKDFTRAYKYDCRKCPIHLRCIDDKNLSPGAKRAIVHAFENRTDTLETWNTLQQDCLLIRREKEKMTFEAPVETGLLRRLREARQSLDQPDPLQPKTTSFLGEHKPVTPAPTSPAQEVPCAITVTASQRMVRLPDEGEVVLGRFEYGISNPPDLDLSFDDGEFPSISRRHALITGRKRQHWLEDMGSTNGTYLNGRQLSLGESVRLAVGDRILLGRCRLSYTPIPEWALEPDPLTLHTCTLFVMNSGDKFELPDKSRITLGRRDPSIHYIPDVDLGAAGNIGLYVSRRHAQLIKRGEWHFLEEMGSTAGTRLNGRAIRVGDPPVLLHPGDQVWLGGCVVAYEWKLL